jgi:hypothetical protein
MHEQDERLKRRRVARALFLGFEPDEEPSLVEPADEVVVALPEQAPLTLTMHAAMDAIAPAAMEGAAPATMLAVAVPATDVELLARYLELQADSSCKNAKKALSMEATIPPSSLMVKIARARKAQASAQVNQEGGSGVCYMAWTWLVLSA